MASLLTGSLERIVSSPTRPITRTIVLLFGGRLLSVEVNRDLGMLINLALQVPVFGLAFFFALFCLGLVAVTVSSVLIIRRRSIAKTIIASLGMEKSDNILHKEGGRYDQLNLKV